MLLRAGNVSDVIVTGRPKRRHRSHRHGHRRTGRAGGAAGMKQAAAPVLYQAPTAPQGSGRRHRLRRAVARRAVQAHGGRYMSGAADRRPVAVVSGGSRGLGLALVTDIFLERGYRVESCQPDRVRRAHRAAQGGRRGHPVLVVGRRNGRRGGRRVRPRGHASPAPHRHAGEQRGHRARGPADPDRPDGHRDRAADQRDPAGPAHPGLSQAHARPPDRCGDQPVLHQRAARADRRRCVRRGESRTGRTDAGPRP